MSSSAARPKPPPGPYLVVGLARSGVAAANLLARRGETVLGCDSGSPTDLTSLDQNKIEYHVDSDGLELLERGIKTVIKSPGVPSEASVIQAAHLRSLNVIGELELAWRLLPNRFIAITGTNGKTTTTELIGHIYKTAGLPVEVCGNIGRPATELVDQIDSSVVVVCETSSFQLEDSVKFAPDTAVLLNITPDHIDRHHTLAAYREAKLKIFSNQTDQCVAVISDQLSELAIPGDAAKSYFGDQETSTANIIDNQLSWQGKPVVPETELSLRGSAGRLNSLAALAVAASNGVPLQAIGAGLKSFAGIPHRLEWVCDHNGVDFVNDSKATNVASTLCALDAFSGGIHLILGGSSKGSDFKELLAPVKTKCTALYLIGRSAAQISEDLSNSGVNITHSNTLQQAFNAAAASAQPGETVLLSPACASFDQFKNFEERGDSFRSLAMAL